MDQKKAGLFFKQLRHEKQMTQEQLANVFNVSTRTISRWENGTNLPDISLLVEIADFYDVDVRELIEGERKSEMMNEEVKEVAEKMADYAGTEKGKLFKWVRAISLIGTILLTIAIVLQCINYEPNLTRSFAIALTFLGLVALAITTLYANGILSNLVKKKGFVIKVVVLVLIIISVRYMIMSALIVVIGIYDSSKPFDKKTGIENYDKNYFLETYSGDLDSGLFVFPDDTENALTTEFESSMKTGLFDTDGSIFLTAIYSDEDFDSEVKRLSEITCTVFDTDFEDSDYHISEVKYDADSYNFPAYVTSDGYKNVYEYALIDDADNEIIYVYLSYPDVTNASLAAHQDYLKKDKASYVIKGSTLNEFSIYSFHFKDDIWCEYTPGDEERELLGNQR